MLFFFFQAEDGIRDDLVTGVQTCALPISTASRSSKSPIRSDASAPTSWSFHTIGSTASVDAARPSARPNVPWTWLASRAANARRSSGPPAPFHVGSAEPFAPTHPPHPPPP